MDKNICDAFPASLQKCRTLRFGPAVVKLYRDRRDIFCGLCEKYLTGKATWTVPTAGMFVWFRVPKVKDTTDMIKNKAVDKKVLLVPGGVCAVC